ncbi:hypothetical protein ASE21_19395 [Flavobacterium sp. Root901]|uniref:hypothetical protein n=1 Tax=Flavobacterium sp. Root901 TaxID=1736605 RepID=UPI00070F85ED|nr:hypothetical protein [Flavobacterium sp. Root901]KRD06337.1 hypothetical protein ASE21_19395 [Flavobacterium sp. Root901]
MKESIQTQMYIIKAECYKCDAPMNIAIIKSEKRNGFCGPEAFSTEEKRIAENNGVIIREQHSYTMEQTYDANTCPHCNAFVGQHYLLTEYFVPAECSDYEYKVIDIS